MSFHHQSIKNASVKKLWFFEILFWMKNKRGIATEILFLKVLNFLLSYENN